MVKGRLLLCLLALAAVSLPASGLEAEAQRDDCAAPCGTINPIINLEFPEKKDCGSDLVLGVEAGPGSCMMPPTEDESVVVPGVINWYWDVTNEGTYPADPTEDIDISFYTTPGNPDWIKFKVEPAQLTLTAADLVDPQHMRTTGEGTDTIVYYWYEAPIEVTFTRNGDPDDEAWQRINEAGGIVPVYVRVQSTASGDRFMEGYGLEEFKFHVDNDPVLRDERASPAPAWLVAPVAVAVAAFMRRRR